MSQSALSSTVLRTIGTNVRWLGPVTGPNAFNCSTLHGTVAVTSTSLPPTAMGWGRSDETVEIRLLRSRIAHLFTEHDQRTNWRTCLASNLVLGVANALLYRVVPPTVALLT
jgi:hypothetical protein